MFYLPDKPKDVNAFLQPFVVELNRILRLGLDISGTTITVKLRCFICDTPARSMLRGKYPASYHYYHGHHLDH